MRVEGGTPRRRLPDRSMKRESHETEARPLNRAESRTHEHANSKAASKAHSAAPGSQGAQGLPAGSA
jgi:hypothetical protein